jgi:hypothetical protein
LTAIGFALILYGCWFVIGLAASAALRRPHGVLQRLLPAPAVGLAIVTLLVAILNVSGLPIGTFALPLTGFVLVLSAYAIWRLRPPLPVRQYALFAVVIEQELTPGNFHVLAMPPPATGRRRVELQFSALHKLAGADTRQVAAKLKSVAFEAPQSITPVIGDLGLGGGWYPSESAGGQRFRWVSNDATLAFLTASPTSRQLTIEVEPGPGEDGQPFGLEVRLPLPVVVIG